ncbi:response regulator [Actinoplanes sp. NPDC049599]|uniref:response regulator n=1 Tax=Actinoplanes sp. NPDC049599 TaxID=3363903 RepID=UPI0037A8FD11
MTDRTIRVVLVDDQSLIRSGIATLLAGDDDNTGRSIEVVGEASDGAAALPLIRRIRPDVVLMDIRMPGTDGIEATRQIRADPVCRASVVLMLTTFDTDEDVLDALRAGADGYLLKAAVPFRLRAAVRAAADGEPVLSPAVARQVMAHAASTARPEPDPRLERLTVREREVLTALAQGEDNSTVARAMRLSPETVRTYVSRLLAKLGATSRAQLVAIAHRSGLSRR